MIDSRKIVEVKSLSLTANELSSPIRIISDALRGMAYSLRGNNDSSYRLILLLYQSDLNQLPEEERIKLFKLIQAIAQPYWNEFSWIDASGKRHDGHERFQIWIEAGRVKCTPTLLLDRFWTWGEDGTPGKAFGELEYKAVSGEVRGTPDKMYEPIRSIYKEFAFWEGLPHLTKEKALISKELYAVPSFFVLPFFYGFITPDTTHPFLSWHDVIRRENASAQLIYQSHIAQYLPQSSKGNMPMPRVQWHVSSSRDTYMAPGGALYAFSVAAKSNPTHYYAYQPTTQNSHLTKLHLAEARIHGGVQKSGKCLIWRTIDADNAISPKPGLPFGPYYSVAWIYSGLIHRQIQQLIESDTFLRAKSLVDRQAILNKFLDDIIPYQTYNTLDELEPVNPKRFAELWYSVRATGFRGWLRRRQSPLISEDGFEIYKDSFLKVLSSIDTPPMTVRKVPVIELPHGVIVNLMSETA